MSINKRRNIFMSTIQQCRQCLNTTQNPSIRILENGLCNVCNSFQEHYDPSYLDEEVSILKNYVRKNSAHKKSYRYAFQNKGSAKSRRNRIK